MVSVDNSSKSGTSMKTDGSGPQYFADSTKGNIKEAYHFERKLANGGFGIVYLAEHRQTKQKFAVKAIQKKKLKDYTTFINEINILKVLDHPNIIKLHEIWEWNEVCFLVLEYCEGGELFNYILKQKHLSEAEAAMIMKQLFSALLYVHSMNISHRDIKPENFMLAKADDSSCVKMIDFGLSKDFSGQEVMKTMSGSPYYIAPEVFLQNYNSKIDIWSMGVVLYIMLSGKVPFPGNSELEIIGNVIKGDFHFNHEPFQRHSKEAKEFLLCLIKKDVTQRYTAEQALNHPWIQNSQLHSNEAMSTEQANDLENTISQMRRKKAILLYLSDTVQENNLQRLSESMKAADKTNCGYLDTETFKKCLMLANMSILGRELQTVIDELTTEQEPRIPVQYFLDAVYLTHMYIHEMDLYKAMKDADVDGQNGVTITEVKQILSQNSSFQLPEEALGAAFKAMLGADINTVEPDCIIDTEKFIASLHKQFDQIAERSLSQIK